MNYEELHSDCENCIEGYCSKYNYTPVKIINYRCDKYKKRVKNEEK